MKKSSAIRCIAAIAFILAGYTSCYAQAVPPKGAAYDKLVKAYKASFTSGDLREVKAALPAVEKAYPSNPFTLFFKGFYEQASGGDAMAAMKAYSDAIRLAPDFSDPYRFRAGMFADKGLFDRAVADMDAAIRIEGKSAGAIMYADRAEFKAQANDASGALEDFKTAASLDPANAKYYRGIANMAIASKNPAAAESVFNTALAGGGTANGGIRAAFADFLLKQNKWNEADEQFRLAFASKDFQPGAKDLNAAALAAFKRRDYSRAAAMFERAIAADPRDVSFLINRASVAMEQKAWEDVYMYASKAVTVNAQSSMANMMMAIGVKFTNRGDALAADYETKAKQLEAQGK